MKAIIFHEHGGRENLRYEDVADPQPTAGEARVRVRACALNYLDIFVRRGMPGLPIELPHISGGDIAGEVESLGADVVGFSVGDRVLVDPILTDEHGHHTDMLGETTTGGLAEFITVPAKNLIPIPEGVSYEDAASLPVAYGTARRMMITQGNVTEGEHVLILGASGGVGTGCVQIGKALGAKIYAASSTEDKLQRLQTLGADVRVNYREEPNFHRTIRALTDGRGVDVCINYTGGDSWVKSMKAVRVGGRILTCGATAGFDPQTDIRYIWTREITIQGSNGWEREDLVALLDDVQAGRVKPIIDKVLPLADAAEGHRLLEDREVFGKVVIVP